MLDNRSLVVYNSEVNQGTSPMKTALIGLFLGSSVVGGFILQSEAQQITRKAYDRTMQIECQMARLEGHSLEVCSNR